MMLKLHCAQVLVAVAASGVENIPVVFDDAINSSAGIRSEKDAVAVVHDFMVRDDQPPAEHVSAIAGFCATGLLLVLLMYTRPWAKCKSSNFGGMRQVVTVLSACFAFMLVGPSLVVLNKYIMKDIGFPYPLSLSGLGVLSSSIFSKLAVGCGFATVRPESMEAVSGRRWLRTALPVGACKAMTLATGNAAYLYLGLGFIQMLKAMTPAVVLVVMLILGTSRPSRSAVFCVFVIIAGTVLEVKGEMHATVLGLILMAVSEVVEALNLVLTQILLQEKKFTVMEGMYVLQPPSAACLFLVAAFYEWPAMVRTGHVGLIVQHSWCFLAAALFGLAVNFVSMLLVQVTSSLFCKILNTARSVGLVYFGVLVYGEECGFLELVGYSVALLGFAGYNYVQIFPKNAENLEHLVESCCAPVCGCCMCAGGQLAA